MGSSASEQSGPTGASKNHGGPQPTAARPGSGAEHRLRGRIIYSVLELMESFPKIKHSSLLGVSPFPIHIFPHEFFLDFTSNLEGLLLTVSSPNEQNPILIAWDDSNLYSCKFFLAASTRYFKETEHPWQITLLTTDPFTSTSNPSAQIPLLLTTAEAL